MIDILIYGLVYIFLLGFLNWSRPAPVAPKATPKGPKQKVRMGRSPAMNLGLKNAGWSRNDHFTSGHTHTHTQTHTDRQTDRQTDRHIYIYGKLQERRIHQWMEWGILFSDKPISQTLIPFGHHFDPCWRIVWVHPLYTPFSVFTLTVSLYISN